MTRQIFYNILMMVPFGLLLPAVLEYRRSHRMIILSAFVYSLSIELIQLIFRVGAFETDDILNNCIGALVGYGISMLFHIFYITKKRI